MTTPLEDSLDLSNDENWQKYGNIEDYEAYNLTYHNSTEQDRKDFLEFILSGVLLIIISIFGFVGNALSIYVLLRPSVRGIFSNILMGLASFDAMFLICAIVTFGLPTVSEWYKKNIFLTIMPVSYGLTHTARVGSVFATLSVTLERFFAIVFPFKDVDVVKRWLIPATITFTVTYNIPKFFEVTTTFDPHSNETVIVGTEMRQNPIYASVYVVWSKLILTDLVPYFIILVLNSFIVVKIVHSSRFRAKILQARNEHQQEEISEDQLRALEKQRQEHKLGILLVAISILFILCQSFKIIPDLYEIMFCSDIEDCSSTAFIAFCVNLSHLLVCFNSSANFVIYLLGGEKFRRAWCQTYLCGKMDNPHARGGNANGNNAFLAASVLQMTGLNPVVNLPMQQTFRMTSRTTTMTTTSSTNVSRKASTSNRTLNSLALTNGHQHNNVTTTALTSHEDSHLEMPLLHSGPASTIQSPAKFV